MHPHEEQIVRAFFLASKRDRYATLLGNKRRRPEILDRLNHLNHLDPRYATAITSERVLGALKAKGAPETCYVISDDCEIDGKEMPLADAIHAAESGGLGTILGCIPGRLAYYYGESGEVRLLLERE